MMESVLDALNQALRRAMASNPDVLLLGEDLLDPYGGAFKVSRGLSSVYPEQVLTTPISEAGMVGLAGGMALRGLRPVVEIMFGDFVTLAADQLINHAAKFRWMYNDSVQVPLVVRTPMGGRRGYGPTHSQSLEKLFLGVPGLRVLAPVNLSAPGAGGPDELLYAAICAQNDPLLFVENKLQYLLPVYTPADLPDFEIAVEYGAGGAPEGFSSDFSAHAPCYRLTIQGAPPPVVTLAAYGYMAELARQAALRLAYEDEIFCEVVVPTQLAPFALQPLLDAVGRSGRLLAIEESSGDLGWSAEVLARAAEGLGTRLKAARRLSAAPIPVPASPALEQAALPQLDDILKKVRELF